MSLNSCKLTKLSRYIILVLVFSNFKNVNFRKEEQLNIGISTYVNDNSF